MNANALRIVHVVSSLRGGGMERATLRFAAEQRQRGHESVVVALNGGPLLDEAVRGGLSVHVLGVRDVPLPTRLLRTWVRFVRLRPQIVHCHNPTSLHYAVIAKVAGTPRLVFTDHAQSRGMIRVPSRLEWRLVDAHTAVSADTARHAGDIGYHGRSEVVYNGITLAPARRLRDDVRRELGLGDGLACVNVGTFARVKAQDILVRAASLLNARGMRLTVVLIGDGGERSSVEEIAREAGLGHDQVRFLGFRHDVTDLLPAFDFFVLSSRNEGFSISLLEAMSHRLPVVCTDVGGNRELVTDGEHGYIVPADNPEALADAMARVAGDADLRRRMADSAYARVRGAFTLERTIDRYETIYRRVLGHRD